MKDERSTIRLREYLGKQKKFVIPSYQRGYVWGKKRPAELDSVTYLMHDLKKAFTCKPRREVFLQGVTVTESDNAISVIDGQQRTTFFYLLLKSLGSNIAFKLQYLSGRSQSQRFLDGVSSDTDAKEDEKEPFQDIYFFKKTIRIIRQELQGVPRHDFEEFLLDKVMFLYIKIPEPQATRVFTMMNGNKATMLPEEVIKAEILRIASQKDLRSGLDASSAEWQANMLRNRYAREWDKWLHWWNREDVRRMFCCDNVMGMLISSVAGVGSGEKLTFELFRKTMLGNKTAQEAKGVFDRLRRQQKLFEDLFNNSRTHNMLGAIFGVLRNRSRDEVVGFVHDFIANPNVDKSKLDDYYKCVFLGMTHHEIVGLLGIAEIDPRKQDHYKDAFQKNYDETLNALRDPLLYQSDKKSKECAFRYLLRRNVDQDTSQGRKFDFSIWQKDARSLEHIFPKSKVWHWQDDTHAVRVEGSTDSPVSLEKIKAEHFIDRESIGIKDGGVEFKTTEHGIGNLVLLFKDENSGFNDFPFETKKELFFNPNKTKLTKSRRLLHTVCVFAEQKDWTGESIARNAMAVLAEFDDYYKDLYRRFYV